MTAQIGADGLDLFGEPRPELLTEVARVQPEADGEWVHLGRLGFRSTQRLRISDLAGGVAIATWPAELAPQARYLYGRGLGSALVAVAIERGWMVEPSPHIAYHTAPPSRRLYMRPSIAPFEYAARWEDEEALCRVGPFSAAFAVAAEWRLSEVGNRGRHHSRSRGIPGTPDPLNHARLRLAPWYQMGGAGLEPAATCV